VGGYVCDKNAGGCVADVCNCDLGAYGDATWSCNNCGSQTADRETISNFGSGSDGLFEVRAFYFDDCAAGYYGASGAALQAICSFAGTREACFPYEVFPIIYVEPCQYMDHCISESLCMVYVPTLANKCGGHAASRVRTTIYLSQGTRPDETHHFCTELGSINERQGVARVARSAGLFNVTGVIGNTRQISAGDSCGQ
jgi:hypothetical protein